MFHSTYPCAQYAAFWHVAPLHIANAVLQNTSDPYWWPYFMLCLDSYADLYGAFRVAGAIIKSLLSIALRLRVITPSKAQALMAQVDEKGIHHSHDQSISASFIVDLDLADVDPLAAQLMSLSNSFDDMALFGEFTELETDTLVAGEDS